MHAEAEAIDVHCMRKLVNATKKDGFCVRFVQLVETDDVKPTEPHPSTDKDAEAEILMDVSRECGGFCKQHREQMVGFSS